MRPFDVLDTRETVRATTVASCTPSIVNSFNKSLDTDWSLCLLLVAVFGIFLWASDLRLTLIRESTPREPPTYVIPSPTLLPDLATTSISAGPVRIYKRYTRLPSPQNFLIITNNTSRWVRRIPLRSVNPAHRPLPSLLASLTHPTIPPQTNPPPAETTIIPFSTLPACASSCGPLYDVNGKCVPPNTATAAVEVYQQCFCSDARLAPFSTATAGVCDSACTAAPADYGSITSWYQSMCSSVQALEADATTTTDASGATTTVSGSSSRGGGGGGW